MSKYADKLDVQPSDIFKRVADCFSSSKDHANRMAGYMNKFWFLPSSPALYCASNKKRGFPISCFLNEVDDDFADIVYNWNELASILNKGGGVGSLWSKVRSAGENLSNRNTRCSGIVPFIKVVEAITTAVNSTSRRGHVAIYLHVDHPEILEFINIRNPFGGDPLRKCHHIHHAIVMNRKFLKAVIDNDDWALTSRSTGEVVNIVPSREIFEKIMGNRHATGEPYLMFEDNVWDKTPEIHKLLGLYCKTSNLCTEIVLPTGMDHRGKKRTAVCCLGSVNVERLDEWKNDEMFIEDSMRFLDGMLDDFIGQAKHVSQFERAVYSAQSERSVGLGVVGLHSYAQKKMLAFDGPEFAKVNKEIFNLIQERADKASVKLAKELGSCWDAKEVNIEERFVYKTAVAPTSNISLALDTSPGIEPYSSNAFVTAGKFGTQIIKNKNLNNIIEERFDKLQAEKVWKDIVRADGSIQKLNHFDKHEKNVFKTAFEISQNALIDMAAERKVCQAQSLNLFINHDEEKRKITQIHINAANKLKTIYYCKTRSGVNNNPESMESVCGSCD